MMNVGFTDSGDEIQPNLSVKEMVDWLRGNIYECLCCANWIDKPNSSCSNCGWTLYLQ